MTSVCLTCSVFVYVGSWSERWLVKVVTRARARVQKTLAQIRIFLITSLLRH
jgi:hypothetical protein